MDLAASVVLLSKPGIVTGVAVAGLAGMVLAQRGLPNATVVLLCLGSIVAAASGASLVNGVLDAPLDGLMPRVARRVEARTTVGSGGALSLAAALIVAAVVVSYRYLNGLTAALVVAAVVAYALLYTLVFKRLSPYGTIPGGIPGALPVLVGYAAVSGRIGMDGVILFLVMLLWQPPHFWTLALAHRDEYRDAGVPVLPVAHGEPYTKILIFLYAVSLLPATLALWAFGYCSTAFAGFAGVLWGFFLWSCYRDAVRMRRFRRAFGASIVYILGVLAAVVVDVAMRAA